ncbi:MAG TPA: chemotaxis protein CheW [Polyangia bacterium]|nr:chemotaxis protein CheW [Polyangia bacterium]
MSATVTTENRRARTAPAAARTSVDVAQYLTFMLDGEQFALGILSIKEIVEYGQVTVVPMMPAWIRGVINLRGAVVPVIDLSARFGRGGTAVTKRTCIVIVEVEADGVARDVGVMVDAVNAVLDISGADIEPPPAMGALIRSEFILGMGKVDGRFVIILNAERVLSEDERAVALEIGAGAPSTFVAEPMMAQAPGSESESAGETTVKEQSCSEI